MVAAPSLNLVVLRALDPDQLCRFYTALGLHFSKEQHGGGPVHYASDMGGLVFEIYRRKPQDAATNGTRIGFVVPSLEAALAAVRIQNGAILREPEQLLRGRRAIVRDPEGHKVELVEGPSG